MMSVILGQHYIFFVGIQNSVLIFRLMLQTAAWEIGKYIYIIYKYQIQHLTSPPHPPPTHRIKLIFYNWGFISYFNHEFTA